MLYPESRKWADSFTVQVIAILKTLIAHLAVISIASEEADNKRATDFEVKLAGGTIAVRVRGAYYLRWGDFTLRSRRGTNAKTELAKIKEGHAYRYLYGWEDSGVIVEWILVDLDKVREQGLLDLAWPETDNHDGTFFIAIPREALEEAGCLIASKVRSPRQVNPQASLTEGIERAKQVKCYQPRVTQ